MAFLDIQPVFKALRDVMEQGSGSVRTIDKTLFSGSYYSDLNPEEKSLRALVNTRVEPRLISMERNPDHNTHVNSNVQLYSVEFEIKVAHHMNNAHKLSDSDRDNVKALDLEAADRLFQALTFPQNLKQDSQGRNTNLVSGKLDYVESEFGDLELSDDGPGLLESIHTYQGILKVCPGN